MNYIFLFLSFIGLVSTQPTQAQLLPEKVAGVAIYSFTNYGPKAPTQTKLCFNERGSWYSRHLQKDELETAERFQFYYYLDETDWYTTKDSLYVHRSYEGYDLPFYSRSGKPAINWQITDEIQQIAGFTARKAIGKSLSDDHPRATQKRGDVVAWFATDVPLPYGPDGYQGLPGLIVKLEYTGFERSDKTTLQRIEYKGVEDWNVPTTNGKVEVSLDHAYNPWKLGEKWFKKKKKELGL
jgi:GLPGLI family protein